MRSASQRRGRSLKRARSSGHPSIDKSPGSEEGSGSGSDLRIRKRGESKDELHLLTAAAPPTSTVRSLVSKWDAGASGSADDDCNSSTQPHHHPST